MNSLLAALDLEGWKPMLAALLLPPVPMLVLLLIGAWLLHKRRGWGWAAIVSSMALLWLGACTATAQLLSDFVLHPPAALGPPRIAALKAQPKAATAIVVLGGGMEALAPEYGVGNLNAVSLERLRYGIWLSRETGLPMAFSGGVGWSQPDAAPEARIAARIASVEFGRPLKWVEDGSHDTRGNAVRSVALLRSAGIRHIVLVTHGWHMPRALRAFESAGGAGMRIEAAPLGLARDTELPSLRWMPTTRGIVDVRRITHELAGRLAGA